MFFFVTFGIATDSTKSDPSEIKAVATGVQVETSANIVDPAKLALIASALEQLAAQDNDGEDEVTRKVYGGFANGDDLLVQYVRSADTFKVGNASAWSRAKTLGGFVAGLQANGLIPA